MRPRILLVPVVTELEWAIKPQLEEWADVASFDPPGIGSEPPASPITVQTVVARAQAEVARRGWSDCVVAGDESGVFNAVNVACALGNGVAVGLALGHMCLSFGRSGPRAPVRGEVMAALLTVLETSFRAYAHHMMQVTQGDYDESWVKEFLDRVPPDVAREYMLIAAGQGNSVDNLLRELALPMLFAKHQGCLVYTDEGFNDAVAAYPEASTCATEVKPSASPEFAEALRTFCAGLYA